MTEYKHRDLAQGRWWQLTLCEQMGNIGSEVSRALKWHGKNVRLAMGALERALELLDLTLRDPRHTRSVGRLREIARAREILLDHLMGGNQYGSTPSALQRYYDTYAFAARREKDLLQA
ncbi:MAG: hypothetical protein MUF51_07540 [Vicinamibacteria bacterium]|jgi:hypothetical protein|nr:hypothetical protein [Vicinamibacteria bacterium]